MKPIYVFLLVCLSITCRSQNADIFNEWQSNPSNARLTDFSYAGYHNGEALPAVIDGPIFNVTDYGAVANDGQDDIAAIQNAVDAASNNGGGVVLFPAGTFDFDINGNNSNVWISSSNIVIRGAGSGTNGTILYDHNGNDNGSDVSGWETVKLPNFFTFSSDLMSDSKPFWYPVSQGYSPLTTIGAAARNSKTVSIGDASLVNVGQSYVITQTDPDQSLIKAMAPGMTSFGQFPGATSGNHAIKIRQIVTVVSKTSSSITIDAPIRFELKNQWNPQIWNTQNAMISEVGVENIRFKMNMPASFVHHQSTELDYGFHHVRFDWVKNGWVRNTVHEGTSCGVYLRSTKNCVVYNSDVVGPEGHHAFIISGEATNNLLFDLTSEASFHTYTFENATSGNVLKDCACNDKGALDLHGGDPGIHNLIENLDGCSGAGGGASKAVNPNHALGLTLWNWKVAVNSPYTGNPQPVFVDVNAYRAFDAPGWTAAGVRGKAGQTVYYTDINENQQSGEVDATWGYVESPGSAVTPSSLYEAQSDETKDYSFCKVVNPLNGKVYPENTTVKISAIANAPSSISYVEFYIDGNAIGTDNSAPYSINWNSSEAGVFDITAKVVPSSGSSVTSEVVEAIIGTVDKVENTSSDITTTGDIELRTTDQASGGSYTRVLKQGALNYSFTGTSIKIYSYIVKSSEQKFIIYLDDMSTPLTTIALPRINRQNYLVWSSGTLTDGTHTIRIKTENASAYVDYLVVTKTSGAIGNIAPTASITSPADGASFNEGSNITINASASDSDGSISKVEFYRGSTKLGEDTTSPYSYTWNNATAGNYSLTVKATDNDGATTTSSAKSIVVTGSGSGKELPGTIQAEDYDAMSGIQTENTSDTGGGKNVGYIDAGDYMDYNVTVDQAGTYEFSYRIASKYSTGEITLKAGSSNLHVIAIPNTGDWQNWQTITATAELTAGTQTIRIYASGSSWNINWFEAVEVTSGIVYAINAGGNAFTATNGTEYEADNYFTSGTAYSTSNSIANTEDDNLYKSERYGNFSYSLPVNNGTYAVTLKLAEIYFSSANQRLFDVRMEGTTVESSLDIYSEAGGKNIAYDISHTITVSDGSLNIEVVSIKDNAKISAIVVESSSSNARLSTQSALSKAEDGNGLLNTVEVYPTVTSSALTIKGAPQSTVRVYNMSGKMIATFNIESDLEKIRLNADAGIYNLVIIKSDGGMKTVKVIKR